MSPSATVGEGKADAVRTVVVPNFVSRRIYYLYPQDDPKRTHHPRVDAAGSPRRGLLPIAVGEEGLPDEPTVGPTPSGTPPKGTPIGKPPSVVAPIGKPILMTGCRLPRV